MDDSLDIRRTVAADEGALAHLYPDAFPDEDLLPVVRALLRQADGVLSLVAVKDGAVVGHVLFTLGTVDPGGERVALLAPLAVATRAQRQGVGSALTRAGLQELASMGARSVLVLGDPAYYGRFGFAAGHGVEPPYPLPKEWSEAWRSIDLNDDPVNAQGTLTLPPAWMQPALWQP